MKQIYLFLFCFSFINGLTLYKDGVELAHYNTPVFRQMKNPDNFSVSAPLFKAKETFCKNKNIEDYRNKIVWADADWCSWTEKAWNCQQQGCLGMIRKITIKFSFTNKIQQ